jgi:hypothetical protein
MLADISSSRLREHDRAAVGFVAQRSNSRQLFWRPAEILTGDKIARSNRAPQEMGI